MSFDQNVAATKIELLKYKRSKQVAAMVQKILDDKRKVLLKNIEEMITEADKARGGIWDPLQDIYKSVKEAYLALGVNTVDTVAQSTPAVMSMEVTTRRIVDVKIPSIKVTEKDTKSVPYGFGDTNSSIDTAAKQIKILLPHICKAAEYENSIFSLANALEKTQKLTCVTIPEPVPLCSKEFLCPRCESGNFHIIPELTELLYTVLTPSARYASFTDL